MHSVRHLTFLLSAASLAACITSTEKKQIRDDIFTTQTRLLNIERLLTDTSKEGKSSADSATKRIASTQADLERIDKELRQIHGDVDALRQGVVTGQMPGADPAQQQNSLAAQVTKLVERLDALEQAQEELLDAIKKAGGKAGPGKKKVDNAKAAATVAELQKAFDDKHYRQVVDDAPKLVKESAGTDKELSKFLLAESYFKLGKMREAALKFNDFVESKPPKKLLPLAKMHLGDAFRALGDGETAKLYYEELIKEFPSSAEAAKAKDHLAEAKNASSKG